ncbi:hypothetical protein GGR50DRAFT_690728 [Xylaria sp. CBS 124048]|nr:hypothetical protein GGR50DRAFT_690728 [Xylaria sp. CBS 124048]
MYSPYGSYSSMSSNTQPLDIAPSSYLSRDSSYHASCAFPSWPQRSSLMHSAPEERATSYLSDDDLFPSDPLDDANSISSGSSTASTSPSPFVSEAELLEMQELQRQKAAIQREALKQLLKEKERRQQQAKRSRRSAGSKKSSPKSKDVMAPITETARFMTNVTSFGVS